MAIKDLKKKTLLVLFIRSIGVIFLFGFTLFITNFFSPENVGRYEFVRTALMMLGAAALMGTNQSIIYYSGLLKARKSSESIRQIYFKMLKIIFLLSTFILLVFLLAFDKNLINFIFKSEESYSLILKTVMALIFFAITMLNIDTIRALHKTILSELYRSLFRYLPVFTLAVILFIYDRQQYLVEAYIFGFFLLSIFSSLRVAFLLRGLKKTNNKSENFSVREIFFQSAPMALSAIAYFIMQSVDITILKIYEGFNQIAYYSVSVKLAMITTLALMSVNIVIAPKIAEIYEQKNMKRLQNIITVFTRVIFFISIAVISGLYLFSEKILHLFGNEYVLANDALVILLAAQLFNSLSGPGAIYLNMTGRQNLLNKILIVGLITNIVLNFYFIPTEGIIGAAKATLISLVVWNTILVSIVYKKDRIKIFLN